MIKDYEESKNKFEEVDSKISQQTDKNQMIKDYINTLENEICG